jgi:hypothetical protein
MEELGSLPQVVVLFVCPHLLQKQEQNELICENLKQEIRFPAHLFQKTKLGSMISSIILSSFHSYLLQG